MMRPEDVPAELVELAARARSPHLWDGTFRNVLLRFKSIAKHTPEQADASIERKRQERRDSARIYLAAALPAYGVALLEEAAKDQIDPEDAAAGGTCTADDIEAGAVLQRQKIRERAARLRDAARA